MIHSLETERLYLRNYTREDLPQVLALRAEPLVWKYSTLTTSDSLADAQRYLEDVLDQYAQQGCGFQALCHKSTGEYLGEAGILALLVRHIHLIFSVVHPIFHQAFPKGNSFEKFISYARHDPNPTNSAIHPNRRNHGVCTPATTAGGQYLQWHDPASPIRGRDESQDTERSGGV